MAEPVFVIVNPRSGKGRGARLLQPVLAALEAANGGHPVAHGLTLELGDEARLAEEALAKGFRRIVAVGGDGTWSNVANVILRSGLPAKLGLVAGGTGCDFAKTVGLPAQDVGASARVVCGGATRRVDVGRVEGRYFLNVVGFGFDIAVLEDSWNMRFLSGPPVYFYCALRQLYSYPGFPVELAVDDGASTRHELMMLIIANARVFGGGFQIAPAADLHDGLLNAVVFRNMTLARRLPIMMRLLRGSHESAPEVQTSLGRSFRLRFPEPPAYETDGEWNRARSTELAIESVPAALDVLVPAGS